MIRVTLLCSGGEIVGFTSEGHAGYADPGRDIVCSAVSALTIATLNGLTGVARAPIGAEVDETDGITCIIDANATNEERQRAALLLETMALGLRSIEKEYKGYLKISEREV